MNQFGVAMARWHAWLEAYRLWQRGCLAAYNQRFGEDRVLLEDAIEEHGEAYDPGTVVEFAEDGAAYPHGAGGTNHVPGVGVPWRDSPHYLE